MAGSRRASATSSMRRPLATPTVALCSMLSISLAAVVLLAAAVAAGPAEAAAAVGPASASASPFPAFVTRPPAPATTPRRRGDRHVYKDGVAPPCTRFQRRIRHGGWFNLRLHQSTTSLAEPRARNSTHHDEDVLPPTAAFAFQNVTTATTKPATRRSVGQRWKEDNAEELKVNASGEDADTSPSPDSEFVEPDDRHEEAEPLTLSPEVDLATATAAADLEEAATVVLAQKMHRHMRWTTTITAEPTPLLRQDTARRYYLS